MSVLGNRVLTLLPEYACSNNLFSLVFALPGRGRVLQKMSGLKDAELPHDSDDTSRLVK